MDLYFLSAVRFTSIADRMNIRIFMLRISFIFLSSRKHHFVLKFTPEFCSASKFSMPVKIDTNKEGDG